MEQGTLDSTIVFCSSLRNRPVWMILSPILMSSSEIQLQEAHLTTHDFTLKVPSSQGSRRLHIILLTPSSLSASNKSETVSRIEHFSTSTDSQDIAIALLLSENAFVSASRRCNLNPLMDLQKLLFSELSEPLSIPIIPISDCTGFLATVQEYISGLASPPRLSMTREPVTSLLAHTTTSAPYHLLSVEECNILSDLFPSWQELSRAVRSNEGRGLLREYLEPETVRRILEFWEGGA